MTVCDSSERTKVRTPSPTRDPSATVPRLEKDLSARKVLKPETPDPEEVERLYSWIRMRSNGF